MLLIYYPPYIPLDPEVNDDDDRYLVTYNDEPQSVPKWPSPVCAIYLRHSQ